MPRWLRDYELLSQAGRGAQGVVWKVHRRGTPADKFFAIKLIDITFLTDKQRELALSEIRVLSMMSDSNAGLGNSDGAKSPLAGSLMGASGSYGGGGSLHHGGGGAGHHISSGVMSVADAARAAAAAVAANSPTSTDTTNSAPTSPTGVAKTRNRPHPGVMRYYDSWVEDENELCIVLEWADGGTLQDWLDGRKAVRDGRMTLDGTHISSNNSTVDGNNSSISNSHAKAVAAAAAGKKMKAMSPTLCKFIWHISISLLTALEIIHANSVLHRDLKCGNIFLSFRPPLFFDDEFDDVGNDNKQQTSSNTDDNNNNNNNDDDTNSPRKRFPRVFVGDFGVSTVLDDRSKASTLCGTPYYLSPETASGLEYDSRSDNWSLGVCLFLLVNCKLPFEAANYAALILKITQARASEHNAAVFNAKGNKSKLSPVYQLRELVNSCMERSVKERPTSQQLLQRHFIILMASQLNLLGMYSDESRAVAEKVLASMEEKRKKMEARRDGLVLQTERRVASRAASSSSSPAGTPGTSAASPKNSLPTVSSHSANYANVQARVDTGKSQTRRQTSSVSPSRATNSNGVRTSSAASATAASGDIISPPPKLSPVPSPSAKSPAPPPLAPVTLGGIKRVPSIAERSQQQQQLSSPKPGSASGSGWAVVAPTGGGLSPSGSGRNNNNNNNNNTNGGNASGASLSSGSFGSAGIHLPATRRLSSAGPSSLNSSPLPPPAHQQQVHVTVAGASANVNFHAPGFYTQQQLHGHAGGVAAGGAGGAMLPAVRGLGASASVKRNNSISNVQQQPQQLQQQHQQTSSAVIMPPELQRQVFSPTSHSLPQQQSTRRQSNLPGGAAAFSGSSSNNMSVVGVSSSSNNINNNNINPIKTPLGQHRTPTRVVESALEPSTGFNRSNNNNSGNGNISPLVVENHQHQNRASVRNLPSISSPKRASSNGSLAGSGASSESDEPHQTNNNNNNSNNNNVNELSSPKNVARTAAAAAAPSALNVAGLSTTVSPAESSPLRTPLMMDDNESSSARKRREDAAGFSSLIRRAGSVNFTDLAAGGDQHDASGGAHAAHDPNEYDDDFEIDWQDTMDDDQQPKGNADSNFNDDGEHEHRDNHGDADDKNDAPLHRSQTGAPSCDTSSAGENDTTQIPGGDNSNDNKRQQQQQQQPESAAAKSKSDTRNSSNNSTRNGGSASAGALTEDQKALADKMKLVVAEGSALIGRDAFDRLMTVVKNEDGSGSFGGTGAGSSRIDQAMEDLEMALRVKLNTRDKLRVSGIVKDAVHCCFRYCLLEAVLDSA